MADEEQQQNVRIDFQIPDDLQTGVYANMLNVWHSAYEFTLDFAVMEGDQAREEDGAQVMPARVVSRIRIPPGIMFEVMKALNQNLTAYEENIAKLSDHQGEDSE